MASNLSVPPSPKATLTAGKGMVDVKYNGLHLQLAPFGLEHIYDHEPGGHHPVHLGDVYGNNGQYRVIHKLVSGGFATVWLYRDTETEGATKYIALKILIAEISSDNCPELQVNQLKIAQSQHTNKGNGAEFICLSWDHFNIHEPNGDHVSLVLNTTSHTKRIQDQSSNLTRLRIRELRVLSPRLCVPTPFLGPNVSLNLFRASEDPDNDLRGFGLQATKVVRFPHSQGACHGDITPNNVLHRVTRLDGLDENEILKILGSPVVNPVLNSSQERHYESTTPKYLVYPVDWYNVDTQFISKEPCLIDFGESFNVSQPPDHLGIPSSYRSPELILERKDSFGSDIWALGCSLLEIRTGRKLFSPFDNEYDEYLDAFVQVLGRLLEPWWSTTWQDRRMYRDEVDEQGLVVAALVSEPGNDDQWEKEGNIHLYVATNARSLKNEIGPGL